MLVKIMWKRAWRDTFGCVHSTKAFDTESEANNQAIDASNAWCGEAFSFKEQEPNNEQ